MLVEIEAGGDKELLRSKHMLCVNNNTCNAREDRSTPSAVTKTATAICASYDHGNGKYNKRVNMHANLAKQVTLNLI